ncbi:MAG: hypothetical protein WBA99_18385 [Nodosilinea sp.]
MSRSTQPRLLPTPFASRVPRRRRRADPLRRLARYTLALELSARLGVNLFLGVIAAVSLGHLVPHLQSQAQQLEDVRAELAQAEAANTRLRAEFDRHFDPAQASRVIQEQTGYRSRSERQVVWTD